MPNTYNPYPDIQTVYNAKVAWNKATTDEERKRQSEIATAARKNLEAYGFSDVANQISASGADATAARKIMESYAPTAPSSTNDTDAELMTKHNNEIRNKTNQLWGTQTNDRNTMAGKYDKLEETAYSNPFTTDEAKAILGKYDLSALQARDNAVASGSAANGGNIDSYAAANAMRQQTALINQGQTAVLDAHNNKINNVKGILESLGVYQQNQDKGMQNTITLQQGESQRLFEDDQTAKNNEVARLSEQASVTGYAPNEWTIKNDDVYSQFLNEDGTFKAEKEGIDIQALINSAKASGDTETAKKLAVVRARKMLGNYDKFGKYMNEGDVAFMSPQQTESRRQFDEQTKATRDALGIESGLAKYEIDAKNKNALDQIEANKNATLELAQQGVTTDKNGKVVVGEDDNWTQFTGYFSGDDNINSFLQNELKPYFDSGQEINEDVIKELLVGADGKCGKDSGTNKYAIKVDDAKNIINKINLMLASINPEATPLDASWLDEYKNRVDIDDNEGMKLK